MRDDFQNYVANTLHIHFLSDENVMLIKRCSNLVVINVEVVGRAEDGDQRWEARRLRFPVHAVARILCLVRPNDTQQVVVLQEIAARRVTEKQKK